MQKINTPEDECQDPEVVQEPESCSEHVSRCWETQALRKSVPAGLCWGLPML